MGIVSSLIRGVFERLGTKDSRVLMLGLDAAGKTTIVSPNTERRARGWDNGSGAPPASTAKRTRVGWAGCARLAVARVRGGTRAQVSAVAVANFPFPRKAPA